MRLAFALAWRNLWRNKRRTSITVASIMMAVLLSTVMSSMQQGQYDQMIGNTVGTMTGHLQIQAAGYLDEPILDNSLEQDVSLTVRLVEMPEIRAVIPRLETYVLLAGSDRSRPALLMGIDPVAEAHLSHPAKNLTSGRMMHDPWEQGVVLAAGLADFLRVGVGDTLVLIGSGYQGVSASGLAPVIGILTYAFDDLNQRMAFMGIGALQTLTGMEGRLTSMPIVLADARHSRTMADRIQPLLPDRQIALAWPEIVPDLVQAIQADRGSGYVILLVLYVVVGFGIFGTVLMMTAERRYELGVMISIGTARRRLSGMLALEMAMMTLLGTLSGMLASFPVIVYFHLNPLRFSGEMAAAIEEFGMEPWIRFSLDPMIPFSQGLVILVITLIISTHPIRHVKRLDPITAMRR